MRKLLCNLLLACVLAGYTLPAVADVANLSWVNATQYTNGTPITTTGPDALKETRVEYGACNTGRTGLVATAGTIAAAYPATVAQVNMVVVQEYCFRAVHATNGGTLSNYSNVVWKANTPPKPMPPGALTVDTTLVAYDLQESDNFVNLVPVGVMKVGTVCDAAKEVLGMYLVKVEDVDSWYGTVRPRTVYASCS